jgi:deoxyinosine 3'endonuclease (endonuclease V)
MMISTGILYLSRMMLMEAWLMPSIPLQQETCTSGDCLLYPFMPTLRAFVWSRVVKLLQALKLVATLGALIFVDGHGGIPYSYFGIP